MRRSVVSLAILLTLACAKNVPPATMATATATATAPPRSEPARPPYPPAPLGDVVDTLHGVRVPDPYRWLETIDSPQTQAWVAAENALTDSYLATVPGRDALHSRIAELASYEKFGVPFRRGGRTFWTHNDGHQNQAVLLTSASLDAPPSVLLNPNMFSSDGSLAFAGLALSRDGKRIAYGLAIGGGDWEKWRVRDVATATDLPDELENIKYYAPAFTPDGKALYYSRFPAPQAGKELVETDHDCRIYLHRIGTPVAQDALVYERKDKPTWQFELAPTHDGHYLVISTGDGQVGDRGMEQIAYLDLGKPGAKIVPLIDTFDAEYAFIGNDGPVLYFKTTFGAARKRIIAIDVRAPARERWKEIVPEGQNAINDATLAGKQLFVTTFQDAHTAVAAYSLQGKKIRDIALPGLGSAFGFGGSPDDQELFYDFASFTVAGAVYRYDVKTGESRLWKSPAVPYDASTLETRQVFFPAKDGTKVPMFITAKKGLVLDGSHPTILYAYGGFGVSITPFFDPTMIAWLERGGIHAVANIRGGGEYGEAWHRAAMREHKQVTYDDFIAAAEWLIANKYTSTPRLGITGTSGGGMMIGAVMTQRPDLFGAAMPIAGVLDMLRYHLFGQGAGWSGDLGSPDDPTDFKALQAWSPLHNVRPGTRYPPTFVITSDYDVRVAPLHSYKFAAALQGAQAAAAPILLRVQTKSGHGGGSTLTQEIDQTTEMFVFFARTLGLPLQ